MTEQVVEIFSNRLNEVLTEVGSLFGRWDTLPREERCPKALAALEKMAELARDADEVSTYLQEAYPPIRLTADDGWRERLNLVWEMIRRVMDKWLSVEEGTMSALLVVVIPDERDRKRIVDTRFQGRNWRGIATHGTHQDGMVIKSSREQVLLMLKLLKIKKWIYNISLYTI